jgi:xanthine/uracil permease
MRLSHLVFALTLIAYAALKLGAEFYNMKLIWIGIIVGTIIWIIEGLVSGVKVPEFRRKPNA